MLPFVGHTKPVRCAAFTPDGGTLISGGADGRIIVWDRFSARPRATIAAGHAEIRSVACHPDGGRFAAGYRYSLALLDSPDRLRFWDTATGEPSEAVDDDDSMWHRAERLATGPALQEILVRNCDTIRDIHFRPAGDSLVYVHASGLGQSAGAQARPEWRQLGPQSKVNPSWLDRRASVTALSLSRDGRTAAVASRDYVRVGRLDAPAVPPGYRARDAVGSIALSPDGRRLAGCWRDRVTVWETAGGQEARDFAGHAGPVEAVAYRPDGSLIASAGLDGQVLLWEPDGGAVRARYDWHLGPVHALAFAPDCLTLAVAGDGGLTVFDLE